MNNSVPELPIDEIKVISTIYGFNIIHGKLIPTNQNSGENRFTPYAVTIMSPQSMKIALLVLNQSMNNYEREFGSINIPPQIYHNLGLEESI